MRKRKPTPLENWLAKKTSKTSEAPPVSSPDLEENPEDKQPTALLDSNTTESENPGQISQIEPILYCSQKIETSHFERTSSETKATICSEECSSEFELNDLTASANHSDPALIPCQIHGERKYYFQRSWYKTFPWLHYDERVEKIFCHTCVYATKLNLHPPHCIREETFITSGFNNWRKAIEKFKKHGTSSYHSVSVDSLQNVERSPLPAQFQNQVRTQQIQARKYLKTIFTSVIYLAKQSLAIRASKSSEGNLNALLKLRTEDVLGLSTWLERSKTFTSWAIQNDVLKIVAHELLRNNLLKIREAKYFSVIVDETSDIAVMEQVSINVRIVSDEFEPEEYFMGLYETSSTTSDSLMALIKDALLRFNLDIKFLRGQCYDGAANMSGKFHGVQAQILAENTKAIFVHCFNHSLNLALQDSSKKIPFIRDLLFVVNDIGTLIRASPKRMAEFGNMFLESESCSGDFKPRPLCPTRWTVRVKSLQAVLNSYEAILKLLEKLSTTHDHASAKAKGLLLHLEKGEFYLGLLIAKKIFSPCERLSKILQSPNLSMHGIIEVASTTVIELEGYKTEEAFMDLWKDMEDSCKRFDLQEPKLPRRRNVPVRFRNLDVQRQFSSAKEMLMSTYFEFVETICFETRARFEQKGVDTYSNLENTLLNYDNSSASSVESLKNVCTFYEWDFESLNCQLTVLKKTNKIKWENIQKIVESFRQLTKETRMMFTDVAVYLKTLLVVPCSSAGAERSFSMLRRIKSYLRSTMGQERLNHCCIINSYSDDLDNLNIDEVMREFVSVKGRDTVFGKM